MSSIKVVLFNSNVNAIIDCDIIFAVTDEKDMGTIWESGFAYSLKMYSEKLGIKEKKIVYYCETLGSGVFNLMLARSGDLVIVNFEDVDKIEQMLESGHDYSGRIE